jgi:hypothetical protein
MKRGIYGMVKNIKADRDWTNSVRLVVSSFLATSL